MRCGYKPHPPWGESVYLFFEFTIVHWFICTLVHFLRFTACPDLSGHHISRSFNIILLFHPYGGDCTLTTLEYTYQRTYRGPLKAIILDWAGTTMDYGCYAPAVVFVEVYKRKDVPITIEEARVPMGAHKKVHIRKISQIESVAQRWQDVHRRNPNEDDVEAMFQEFIPLQLACLADYADLIPGTLEAIAEFRSRGLKIGSTTRLPPRDDGTPPQRGRESRLHTGRYGLRERRASRSSRTVDVPPKCDEFRNLSDGSNCQSG